LDWFWIALRHGVVSRKEDMVTKRWMVVLGVMLLFTLAVVPGASAAPGGTDRPIKGEMDGPLTFDIDFEREVCPVITVTNATGTMSHLGKVSSRWSHCPNVMGGYPAYTNGYVVFTAANGDTFEGEYMDYDGEPPFVIDITGGTGRFDDAAGVIELVSFDAIGEWGGDGLPIQPWHWSGVVKGRISY
jgi:hypothetical protein